MNFQDSIRANIKSKEQVADEQEQALSAEIDKALSFTLSSIRGGLMKKAQRGEYLQVGGKRIIECFSWVLGLGSCVSKGRTVQKGSWGKKIYKTYLTVSSNRERVANTFLRRLKETAAADGISVEGFWAAYSAGLPKGSPNDPVPIPSFVDGYWVGDFYLVVKSRMEV